MAYVVKAEVPDPRARSFVFAEQKTMYGGTRIAAGDVVYVIASETRGGASLVARGVVTRAEALPRTPGLDRQTPRVTVEVRRTALATRPLGRTDLQPHTTWSDDRPETELNFKLYRQATDKIVGITDQAAVFLDGFFTTHP